MLRGIIPVPLRPGVWPPDIQALSGRAITPNEVEITQISDLSGMLLVERGCERQMPGVGSEAGHYLTGGQAALGMWDGLWRAERTRINRAAVMQ